jgi:OOP family OmpA-OmpF porin
MHDGLKIMFGAGATALLAWGLHGPLGQGAAFIADLQIHARSALAAAGVTGVQVDYPDNPYARTASLSGDVPPIDQNRASDIMRGLNGSAGAVWAVTSATAMAAADNAASPPADSDAQNRAASLAQVMADMEAPLPDEPAAPAQRAAPAPAAKPTPTPPAPKLAAVAIPTPPPKTISVTPLAANQCQRTIDSALAGRVMSFRSGSAWLNPQSNAMIADVAAALKRCGSYALEIGGHTDGNGTEGVNRAMSQERANRVREALIARGIPAGALMAKGYGSASPLRAGNMRDPANRRISFTVTRGGA